MVKIADRSSLNEKPTALIDQAQTNSNRTAIIDNITKTFSSIDSSLLSSSDLLNKMNISELQAV